MQKLLILICALAVGFVAWMLFFGCEQYYAPEPYCDTEMAEEFTPEKFLKVKPGMHLSQVESMIGQPLFIDTFDQSGIIYRYTDDGKLLDEQVPWYRCNDYAWYDAKVWFDSAMVVQQANSGWCYD